MHEKWAACGIFPLCATTILSHVLSLNDICDTMRNHEGAVRVVRGASPPSRNGLSHANRAAFLRDELPAFFETLARLEIDVSEIARLFEHHKQRKPQ